MDITTPRDMTPDLTPLRELVKAVYSDKIEAGENVQEPARISQNLNEKNQIISETWAIKWALSVRDYSRAKVENFVLNAEKIVRARVKPSKIYSLVDVDTFYYSGARLSFYQGGLPDMAQHVSREGAEAISLSMEKKFGAAESFVVRLTFGLISDPPKMYNKLFR